tara:strand:- start:2112 stop:2570 length:459 start_codon:yes stop_codon:yes gene_type:complete
MAIPCKLNGTFPSSDTIRGLFASSIKMKGVFKDEAQSAIDYKPIKINGSFLTENALDGLHHSQKLHGSFALSVDEFLGHLDSIKIEGVLKNNVTVSYVSGLFDHQLRRHGRFDTETLIVGKFICVPDGDVCTAYNLDFHYSCNSAHIVSAGF